MNLLPVSLDYCGQKHYPSPSLKIISDLLASLSADDNQYLILNIGESFLQCYVVETFGEMKLYAIEYKDNNKDILYETESNFGFEKTLELFALFLDQDEVFLYAAPWIDSGVPTIHNDKRSNIKSNIYYFFALMTSVIIYGLIKIIF